jgi:hypothetical protein
MVETSQSGSGEGSGRVTARPTLQGHFSAGPSGAQALETRLGYHGGTCSRRLAAFSPRAAAQWTSDVSVPTAYRKPGIRRWCKALGENPSSCQDSVEEIGRLESLSLQRQGIEQGFGVHEIRVP